LYVTTLLTAGGFGGLLRWRNGAWRARPSSSWQDRRAVPAKTRIAKKGLMRLAQIKRSALTRIGVGGNPGRWNLSHLRREWQPKPGRLRSGTAACKGEPGSPIIL